MMTNHTHFLLIPCLENTVSLMMQYLGRHDVRRFNRVYNRTGTRVKVDTNKAWLSVINTYWPAIAISPTNLIKRIWFHHLGDYRWSSYHANARGVDSAMLTAHSCYERLAKTKQARQRAYSQLFDNPYTNRLDTEIRWSITRNLAAGSEKYKAEIDALTGVAQTLKP